MDQQIMEKLKSDIQLCGLSKDTEKDYSAIIGRFQEYYQKPANELGEQEIIAPLYHLLGLLTLYLNVLLFSKL